MRLVGWGGGSCRVRQIRGRSGSRSARLGICGGPAGRRPLLEGAALRRGPLVGPGEDLLDELPQLLHCSRGVGGGGVRASMEG